MLSAAAGVNFSDMRWARSNRVLSLCSPDGTLGLWGGGALSIADLFSRGAPAWYIEGRRRSHPPVYQRTAAAWQGLFDVALNLSTPKLRALAKKGAIASGEIGELTPSTYVTRRGSGYAVEMHSGQMRLIYSAARALTASDAGRFRDDKQAALSAAEVAAQVADLFKNYREHQIATVQLFPATSFQTGWADLITLNAECFLLLHELAHIHNGDLALWRRFLGIERDVRERETAADATACQWMIDYILNPTPGGPQRQVLYAGAEFGLRVRMAMETVGMRFDSTHPPAGDRVSAMRARLRAAAGPRTFYAIANTSIAFDQMWRAIELILRGKGPKFEPALDDVLAGLRTLTVEILAAGTNAIQIRDVPGQPGMKQAVFAPVNDRQQAMMNAAQTDFSGLPPGLRADAKQHAGDVFEPGSAEYSLFLALLSLSDPGRKLP
jgi:hypothetical protein